MTYKENFVVELKCNGKIMRVKDGVVYLPYGSEYTLLLKNLNSRKASVKIHIDGQDVLDYSSLILEANSSTELKGFLNGSVAKNHFKFIHKTRKIQEHRGDKIDDGLIRVEFAFEKVQPKILKRSVIYDNNSWFDADTTVYKTIAQPMVSNNASNFVKGSIDGKIRGISNDFHVDYLGIESIGQPLDDEGITVKGSECNQSFRYGMIGETEQSNVITIQLKGMTGSGTQVKQPITVNKKLECYICGTKSKSSFKYCPVCGTFLE